MADFFNLPRGHVPSQNPFFAQMRPRDEAPRQIAFIEKHWLPIFVIPLLVAALAYAYGNLYDQERLAFWFFVPAALAGLFSAIVFSVLAAMAGKPAWAIAYVLIMPLVAVPCLGLYMLPLYMLFLLETLSRGFGPHLFWDYAAIWWVFLSVASLVLLFSPRLGAKVGSWLLAEKGTGEFSIVASYISIVTPWLGSLMLLRNWVRKDSRRKIFFILIYFVLIVLLPLFLFFSDLGEDIAAYVAIGAFFFFGLSGILAIVLEEVMGTEGICAKNIFLGWAMLAAVAFYGSALEQLGWEIIFTPIIFVVAALAVLPFLYLFKMVLNAPIATRIVWFSALAVMPLVYYPLHVLSEYRGGITDLELQGKELIEQGRLEEGAALLEEALNKSDIGSSAGAIAETLVSVYLEAGEYEKLVAAAEKGLSALKDVPFGYYVARRAGKLVPRGTLEDPVPQQRQQVMDLLIAKLRAHLALGQGRQAYETAMNAWGKAVEAEMWHHVKVIAKIMADAYQKQGNNLDAYWWLAEARNRALRGGAPQEIVEEIAGSIQSLRHAIGEEAFWAIVEECASKDPEWCKP